MSAPGVRVASGALSSGVVLDEADVTPPAAATPSVIANANAVTFFFFNTALYSNQVS
jgi:hypothetical protein